MLKFVSTGVTYYCHFNFCGHPSTKWAQWSDKVYLTIELADAKDLMLNLKHDGHFNFSAKDPGDAQYELHLELFGAIDVEVCVIADKCHLQPELSLHYFDMVFMVLFSHNLSLVIK
jgi:hypothetical protein